VGCPYRTFGRQLCHLCHIMSNYAIHVKSCQIITFMTKQTIQTKSWQSCQIIPFMFHGKTCHSCQIMSNHCNPEPNLLVVARELERGLFSISFSRAADWWRFCDLRNNVSFCQSAAREKKIEKEFGNNPCSSSRASTKRWGSVAIYVIIHVH
jgi:hypothetical protein